MPTWSIAAPCVSASPQPPPSCLAPPPDPLHSHPTLACVRAEEHRELVRRCLRTILAAGYSPLSFYSKDISKYFYLAELLSLVDLSLVGAERSVCVCGGGGVLWGSSRGGACVSLQNSSCMLLLPAHLTSLSPPAPPPPSTHPPPPAHQTVKMGVQYSLWGGSILNLGTERHRRRYFDDIDRFRLPGCFAMTELKHGSNVAGLQTEATLDVHTDEWVVHVSEPCQPGGGCGGCAAAAAAAAAAAVQAGGQTAGWEAESCAAQCTGPPLISQRPAAAAAAAATTSMMPHPRPCLCCPPPLPVLPPAPPSRLCLCPPPPADAPVPLARGDPRLRLRHERGHVVAGLHGLRAADGRPTL